MPSAILVVVFRPVRKQDIKEEMHHFDWSLVHSHLPISPTASLPQTAPFLVAEGFNSNRLLFVCFFFV